LLYNYPLAQAVSAVSIQFIFLTLTAMNPFRSKLHYVVNLMNNVIITILGLLIVVVQLNEEFVWMDEIRK
jgi:uncharacterized protein YhhL (DUF1145 family)